MSDLDLTFVDQCVDRIGKAPRFVLPLLQAIQGHYGYLPTEALEYLCTVSECHPSDVWSVATFYDQFRLRPAGKHFVRVCVGTACHVKGANRIYDAFREHLNISGTDDTDARRLFTVEKVACLGCCMLAPAVQIDDVIYGHLQTETVGQVLDDFLAQQEAKRSDKEEKRTPIMVRCESVWIRVAEPSAATRYMQRLNRLSNGCDCLYGSKTQAVTECPIWHRWWKC